MTDYGLVFLSALGAATLLPFYSEVVVIAALERGGQAEIIWVFATVGNTLGAIINWIIGRFFANQREHKWFPFKPAQMTRAENWFQRYGVWSLLFAWLPVGGDALTFIAGVLRVRLTIFILLTGIGKGLRYALVIYTATQLL